MLECAASIAYCNRYYHRCQKELCNRTLLLELLTISARKSCKILKTMCKQFTPKLKTKNVAPLSSGKFQIGFSTDANCQFLQLKIVQKLSVSDQTKIFKMNFASKFIQDDKGHLLHDCPPSQNTNFAISLTCFGKFMDL